MGYAMRNATKPDRFNDIDAFAKVRQHKEQGLMQKSCTKILSFYDTSLGPFDASNGEAAINMRRMQLLAASSKV